MTKHLSQKLVIRFAQWAAASGGDVESATKLMDAARNHSQIIGARITGSAMVILPIWMGRSGAMAKAFVELPKF